MIGPDDDVEQAGRSLDARLASLPPERPPGRDLWPAIAARLEPRRAVRRWPAALAAGLAVASVAGWLGWSLGHEPPRRAALSAPGALRPAAFAVAEDAELVATRATLERSYRERLALLAPQTRLRVERDLATIRQANEDIRRALATDPESSVLARLLASTWQQEIDLYTTVDRSTEPVVPRTRT